MEAPKLPSFIRQNKHKTFEFKPRYYSESKERIEELRKKYQRQNEGGKPKNGEHLRGELSNAWRDNRNTTVKSSNKTLLLIIVALCAITYHIIMN